MYLRRPRDAWFVCSKGDCFGDIGTRTVILKDSVHVNTFKNSLFLQYLQASVVFSVSCRYTSIILKCSFDFECSLLHLPITLRAQKLDSYKRKVVKFSNLICTMSLAQAQILQKYSFSCTLWAV